jgi:23S rRNA (uracil1939-C5)-methyltransferase
MKMDAYEVLLDKMAYGGEALGRLPDGRAVFVPFALPGEKVRLRLVEEKRGHARAELIEVLEPSSMRIAPRCPHFTLCGGCHYQQLDYSRQLAVKEGILGEQLERIGGLKDVPLQPGVGSPKPWNYRNHVQFHLSPEGRLGYQAARSQKVVPISECHLPEPPLNELWPQLDIESMPGLERVSLRLGMGNDIMLILESGDPEPLEFSVEDLPISAVHLGPGGALVLAGSEYLWIEVLGQPFRVSPAAFFQVNTNQAAAMVEHVLTNLPLEPGSTILDLYCGVGLFSKFLAPRAKRLVGIEISAEAGEDYTANLDEFDNVELYEAPVEDVLASMEFHPDVIVMDPPRSGLERGTMDGLLRQGAGRLVYVSCDPSTLARDAKRLTAAGYRLEQITLFDLFPQTYHIESVSWWKRGIH